MKLMSMTNFVLTQRNKFRDAEYSELIYDYANFLQQSLTIGMTVTCDKFGNVLEEPENYIKDYDSEYSEEIVNYNQAKSRVLFKGFKVRNYRHGSLYSKTITDKTGLIHLFWFDKITETWEVSVGLTNIESLTKFSKIEMTKTALKEIGLPKTENNE